jgi:hypothetical protein
VTTNKEVGFNDRNFGPCICDLDGVSLARGMSPALIGKEFANRDDGIRLNGEMMEVVHGNRYSWDDYKRPNLLEKVIEVKKCDREAWDDSLFGVGVCRS